MPDAHTNFAYSTIVTAPSPASSGTEIVVGTGQGKLFPDTPFNATIWPTGTQPISTNAEIVTVTTIANDTFTIVRAQEGSSARTVIVGDQIAATITAKTLTDAEAPLTTWAPFILASSSNGLQTLNNGILSTGTGSLFMFPVTIPASLQFNQILILNSLGLSAGNSTASNTYHSKFGIYSRNVNTFSLISSNSFSIGETLRTASATWNYPTTTLTAGYGYGGFPAGNLTAMAQRTSYVQGTRVVGLQFGGNMTLSGGVYWIGLLSNKFIGSASNHGLSHAGIVGHVIQSINAPHNASGYNRLGFAASAWSLSTSHYTGWWGRHIIGFMTATSITNFLGTAIPSAVTLSALEGTAANQTASILPAITFMST